MMRKLVTPVLFTALLLASASCSKENDNITSGQMDMYHMIEAKDHPDQVLFTTSPFYYDINYTKKLIKASAKVKLTDTYTATFATGDMAMTISDSGYSFGCPVIKNDGSAEVKNLNGLYDSRMGAIAIDYVLNNEYNVYSVAAFVYEFTGTTITGGGKEAYSTKSMGFVVRPNPATGKAVLTLGRFRLQESSSPRVLSYESIPFTVGAGSVITAKAASVENSEKMTGCDIKNLDLMITDHGRKAFLEFDMEGQHVKMEGNMFYVK